MKASGLELQFLAQVRSARIPEPRREFRFHPVRRWRFDFAWPAHMIAVEVEGGVYSRGRHVRGVGFEKDAEKYNESARLGWRVFRFTAGMLDRNEAIPILRDILKGEES
uniref:DUF559 domain-containing protein n=1 Tax=viral metagenome TaxID=1070528 RepID=A0A6M3K241_9ZZZZ